LASEVVQKLKMPAPIECSPARMDMILYARLPPTRVRGFAFSHSVLPRMGRGISSCGAQEELEEAEFLVNWSASRYACWLRQLHPSVEPPQTLHFCKGGTQGENTLGYAVVWICCITGHPRQRISGSPPLELIAHQTSIIWHCLYVYLTIR